MCLNYGYILTHVSSQEKPEFLYFTRPRSFLNWVGLAL